MKTTRGSKAFFCPEPQSFKLTFHDLWKDNLRIVFVYPALLNLLEETFKVDLLILALRAVKFWPTIFAISMFLALFMVPLTVVLVQDEASIVLLELDEKNEAEEGDVEIKDLSEKLFHSDHSRLQTMACISEGQYDLRTVVESSTSRDRGVETPPPEFS